MIRRFVILVLSPGWLALSNFNAAAQGDDGWPVEQRCVGEPTRPPEGWTFEGTILMTGYAGIHAVQADWETPRVVAFSSNAIPGGALSPDGRWYAMPHGTITQSDNLADFDYRVNELVVYSTEPTSETYELEWDVLYHGSESTVLPIAWVDNQRLIYYVGSTWLDRLDSVIVNPFAEEIHTWESPIDPSYSFYPSPDMTRVVQRGQLYALPEATPITDMQTIEAIWADDSSNFVSLEDDSTTHQQLKRFNQDGELVDYILALPVGEYVPYNFRGPRSRHFAFQTHTLGVTYESGNRLYVADTQADRIIDTCLIAGEGLAWSPDNTHLAFVSPGRDHRPVWVLDIETWLLHTVAYHSASVSEGVIGWRAND